MVSPTNIPTNGNSKTGVNIAPPNRCIALNMAGSLICYLFIFTVFRLSTQSNYSHKQKETNQIQVKRDRIQIKDMF